MKDLLKKFFSNHLFVLILLGITAILAYKNFTPGTWLSGWDTLHPEFDFTLNLKRVFFGVWREEQGVGALPGHSHISEVPRIIFLWFSSFLLKQNFLRYFYFFLTLAIGPLGVYYFLKKIFKKNSEFITSLGAFLGGLYYLLNLGTLQHFYVPFEMFASQFAFLPWLFLFAYNFLNEKRKRDLVFLFLVSFLAAPQAYASTLFYAYFAGLILFLIGQIVLSRERLKKLKRVILILFVIFVTNAFWLLPNLYSLAKQSRVIENSRINTLFSPEAFLRNRDFGSITNVLTHKNFLFSWREFDENRGEFVDLLDEWNDYLAKPPVATVGYLLAGIFVIGMAVSVVKRDKVGIALLLPSTFCIFFLINENPPTGFIFTFLRDNIGAFREAFRTPFTKVSILFMFAASYYFAFALKELFLFLGRVKFLRLGSIVIALLVGASLIFYMLPAFKGFLVSPSMRVEIPKEYFEVSGYLNSQEDKGRVAKFPVQSLWGWIYYDWGFEGAGFNWFGLENPTFDRDFDRWSSYNETFYNQVSDAIYSKDLKTLEEILEKFQVRYLLLDTSVLNPGGSDDLTFKPETRTLFESADHIRFEKSFGSISLYKTDFEFGKDYIWAPPTFTPVLADLTYSKKDPIWTTNGTYFFDDGDIYPFVNFDTRLAPEVVIDESKVIIRQNYKTGKFSDKTLILPDYPKTENSILVEVYLKEITQGNYEVSFVNQTPEFSINGEKKGGGKYYWQGHPIKFQGKSPSYLSVGDIVFNLTNENLNQSETPLGIILVGTNELVPVRIYSSEKEELKEDQEKLFDTSPRWCSDPDRISQIEISNGTFKVSVEKESICWGAGFNLPQNSLLEISFESKSETGIYPKFCLSKAGVDGCLNSTTPDTLSPGEWNKTIYYVPVSSGNYFLDFVAQGQEEGKGEISYRNITMSTFPSGGGGAYSIGENFALVSTDEKFTFEGEIKEIEISFPLFNVVSEKIGLGRGHSKAVNCDLRKVGSVTKENIGTALKYSAKDGGVSCDYLDYLNLPFSQGYIFRVTGENIKGRGLKAYLQNRSSNRMDLEELLPESKFDEKFFILPIDIDGKGYVFNFETRSFGSVESENLISGVEFLHFPYRWLSSIKLEGNSGPKKSELKVLSVKKTGSFLYKVTTEGEGLLVLGQGFENGWVGFSRLKILPHYKVNSWANGWMVPGGTKEITIIFWPQLLEFLGFIFLSAGLGFVLFRKNAKVDKEDKVQYNRNV